ncbi:MAG: hypothetical protein H6Q59_3154 [Firmicutes bacterium]|nr:hypothetical protein [Bacillota bacterium]
MYRGHIEQLRIILQIEKSKMNGMSEEPYNAT